MQEREYDEVDNFWGLPIGTQTSWEAFAKDFWDPSTDEIFPPKNFFGLGWGINFHAIAKKIGIIPEK